MATLTENLAYGYWEPDARAAFSFVDKLVSFKPSFQNADVDTTAGILGHQQIEDGLDSTSYDIEMQYEVGNPNLPDFKPGIFGYFTFGPEGNTAGKPKHKQYCKVSEFSYSQAAKKDAVLFSIKLTGARAPDINMFDGATF